MLASSEGRRVLLQRPQIHTNSVDMAYLRGLQEGTFGKEYTRWLDWNNVGPDTRAEVSRGDRAWARGKGRGCEGARGRKGQGGGQDKEGDAATAEAALPQLKGASGTATAQGWSGKGQGGGSGQGGQGALERRHKWAHG
jgi:hypothetical protein